MRIEYIGPADEKVDTVAGTGLTFPRLEPIEVPVEAAIRLLRFPDTWAPADGERITRAMRKKIDTPEPRDEEEESVDIGRLPLLQFLDRPSLERIAISRFGARFDNAMSVQDMRDRIVALENSGRQRGV